MLEIGRGALVIIAGYALMAFLIRLTSVLLGAYLPPVDPADPGLSAMTVSLLGCAFISGGLGGWLTARLAASKPLLHTSILCAAILGLGVVLLTSEARGGDPAWYPAAALALAAGGALLGGLVRAMRVERIS
jgi:hypothetical protein